jgi:hypothetical protein
MWGFALESKDPKYPDDPDRIILTEYKGAETRKAAVEAVLAFARDNPPETLKADEEA